MCKRNAGVLFSSSGFLLAASNTHTPPAFSRLGCRNGGECLTLCPHNKETGDKKGDSR